MAPSSRPRTQRRAAERARLHDNQKAGRGAGKRPPEPGARAATVIRVLTAVVAAVVLVAIVMVIRPWEDRDSAQGADEPVLADSTHLLNDAGPDAPVLVEFLDFECEACGYFYPTVEDLRQRYGDDVTFAVRYFPLPGHANSTPAAIAVEAAAQQNRFEDMYSQMFATQTQWGERPQADPSIFRTFAADLGLDMAAYDAAVADPATAERVQFDYDAGRSLGVTGTPTFFLDGERLELNEPDDLETALQQALDQ